MSFARAAVFLWAASARNRLRRQLRRLAQPRYLAGAVAGVAYLYSVFLRRLDFRGSPPGLSPAALQLVALGSLAEIRARLQGSGDAEAPASLEELFVRITTEADVP